MRCSGLLIIMEPDRAVLLCARRAYNLSVANGNHFLEKISIPRGKWDSRDIFDYETAVREFIEETGTFFENAYVYRSPFLLHWQDHGVVYRYTIYVGILKGPLRTVSRKPNTYCVKLQRNNRDSNEYQFNLQVRRHNHEIPRNLYIVPIKDYFQYMRESQLVTYDSSNYLDFFDFVEQVKIDYDSGQLNKFFTLSLRNVPIRTPAIFDSEKRVQFLGTDKTAALRVQQRHGQRNMQQQY